MARYQLTTTDKREFQQALKATDYLLALWEMDSWLRGQVKYGYDLTPDTQDAYEKAREELHDILAGYGISLDELE